MTKNPYDCDFDNPERRCVLCRTRDHTGTGSLRMNCPKKAWMRKALLGSWLRAFLAIFGITCVTFLIWMNRTRKAAGLKPLQECGCNGRARQIDAVCVRTLDALVIPIQLWLARKGWINRNCRR